jgi:excinuclease ABC subunit B
VAILDADKEGFLRNVRSLVQTVGRAARNVNGKVLMYADKMTDSMQRTIEETARRRLNQEAYNLAHNQVPTALQKSKDKIIEATAVADGDQNTRQVKSLQAANEKKVSIQYDAQFENPEERVKELKTLKKAMESAAKALDFIEAARIRDLIKAIEKS